MAKKPNKYIYLWVVQGYYGTQYGWEDVCASESYRTACSDLKAHRENESYRFRLIKRREPNPEYKG